MFAIFEDGGRQYKVSRGDVLLVDYRADARAGEAIVFDKILLANGGGDSVIGLPTIRNATILGTIENNEYKGPKLEIQKLRRRHASRRHTGHRQKHLKVRIDDITVPGLRIVEKPAETAAT